MAPFLACSSPAEFVALQQRVDMPRLVEALEDWGAVRLGALGPMREDAAHLVQRKRAAFLVSITEHYGLFHSEVFALFVLHSAYDDEVNAVLQLLAGDKLLGQTLALMPAVRQDRGDGAAVGSEAGRGRPGRAGPQHPHPPGSGRFVAVGGVDAALALREARGDVARAQALMSKARPGATGSSASRSGTRKGPGQVATVAERTGSLASLVDEGAGLTREVVEARLALVELEAPGPRLPRNVAVLEKQRPSPDAPPPGVEANPRWGEYVAYYEKRLGELKQGMAAKAPLRWAP